MPLTDEQRAQIKIYDFGKSEEQGGSTLSQAVLKGVGEVPEATQSDEPNFAKLMNATLQARLDDTVEDFVAALAKVTDKKNKKRSFTGYIKKSDFDALNVSTVSIPENFAGLESQMTPTRLQEQLFRIVEVVEDEDCVTITARHVWYDNLENYTLWKPTETTNYTAAAVCRNILSNAISPVNSRVASDCTDTKVGKDLDFERKNLVEAFLDPEKGVCAKFGLSLIRNNWDFYCLKEVGYDRGIVIQNGKNLLGVERTESIENLATRICPIGKDDKGNIVWLNYQGKKYIDSQYIDDYSYPRTEIFDTGLQIGKEDVTAQNIQDKLLQKAQEHLRDDKVDLPEVTMTIEFLSLGDTEEYIQYRDLDKVYLYDILTIKDTIRGYNYSAQVVGVEHDILTGMLNSVTIGSISHSDGSRKIATWQVPEVSGENIRLKSITAGAFDSGAINADDIAANSVMYIHLAGATIDNLTTNALEAAAAHIHELIAGSITADDIQAGSITTELLAAGAITADKIGAGEIEAVHIAAGSIDTIHIAADAVTATNIASEAVTTDKLYAGAVTAVKIAADAVTSDKILAGAVTTAKLDASAVTADKVAAGAVTADKIAAGAINADKIDATQIEAINAKLATATISSGFIQNAFIDYARVKDITAGTAIITTSITDQGVADKLYINRLSLTYGQMVEATIGDLVIGDSNGGYYHIDVVWDEYGVPSLVPTQVDTPTAEEIEQGHTSTGKTIIGDVGTYSDLSTEDFYAINSVIDRITAKRIDVNELWAREAFINKLMVTDISSNTYIQSTIGTWESGSTITQTIDGLNSRIASLGYGTIFYQTTEPDPSGVVVGDIWIEPIDDNTWDEIGVYTWEQLAGWTWDQVAGQYRMYVWDGQQWKLLYDNLIVSELMTEISQTAYAVTLKADKSVVDMLSDDVTAFAATLEVQAEQITAAVSSVNQKTASYTQATDPADDPEIYLSTGDTWVKAIGDGTWAGLESYTWDDLADFTWDELVGASVYTWNGTGWTQTADYGAIIQNRTLIEQTDAAIRLEAEKREILGDKVDITRAELAVANDRITAEVSRATSADNTLIQKTQFMMTSGMITLDAFSSGLSGTALGVIKKAGITIDAAGKIDISAMTQDARNAINKAAGISVNGNGKILISALENNAQTAINKSANISVNSSGKILISALESNAQTAINKSANISVDSNGKIELNALQTDVKNAITKAAGINVNSSGKIILSALDNSVQNAVNKAAGISVDSSGKIVLSALSSSVQGSLNKVNGISMDERGKITSDALSSSLQGTITKAAGITVDGSGKIVLAALETSTQNTINKAAGISVDGSGKIILSALSSGVQSSLSKADGANAYADGVARAAYENSKTYVASIGLSNGGVDIVGNKHINLDVDANNYVHINNDGITLLGKRVTIDGYPIWGRDDIIVMNPNDATSWRRTVAGIEAHMATVHPHDWVLIKPYYDAQIIHKCANGDNLDMALDVNAISNLVQEDYGFKAFGNGSDWYNYSANLAIANSGAFRQITLNIYLANTPFTFSSSADRASQAAAHAQIILSQDVNVGGQQSVIVTLDSGHVGYNLCGDGATIYYYINGLGVSGFRMVNFRLTSTTDLTTGKRVPCSTYYYS